MAYDPYKSLLANASRERVKRSTDLNTHLVGNVFLPAIDAQPKKKPSASTASLKHLKVIEQCIMAENKREERLAKCATVKERRIITKKFHAQRERERELIQALMLGNYPERQLDIKLLDKEAVVATTPRQQRDHEITGLSARVATPDRVFRKTDVTGGVPKANQHLHKKFKLPECNGSPGKKSNSKAQDAASLKLSSPCRRDAQSTGETQAVTNELPTQKKRSPSSAKSESNSVRSPKTQVKVPSESTTTFAMGVEEAASPDQRTQSPYISLHQHHATGRSAKATAQLSSLPNKPAENVSSQDSPNADANAGEHQRNESSVAFEGAVSFSEAQRLAEAMGSDAQRLKEKCERILAEIATQTTPRLQVDALQEDNVSKASSRPELPPMDPSLVAALTQDVSATTPRRPQSDRAQGSTRQSFLENLARENKILQEQKKVIAQQAGNDDTVGIEATHEDQSLVEEDRAEASGEEGLSVPVGTADALGSACIDSAEEEYDDDFAEPDAATDDEEDDDLETDVAEALFDLVDMVAAAISEGVKEKVIVPSPRSVSPRPRSSMGPATKYVLRIQSVFRGYRARIAFRLALYEDALNCGVLGAMPGTIQGRSGWYLDPKRLMAYYFVIPELDGEWEQKFTLRCSRLVLTPYEMRLEVLSKAPADVVLQYDAQQEE
ncbi:hypothetical protein PHYPSEUDO_002891 [Phytophthora pseudosyringae]|uniref:Uncharacterized protein n=1 Tax=Phytophthora pseudosyringae TaxID=221518 RepID=A0A8T1VW76_9STRA|nr:hypothetical protein PHYPSEUDO_002891 [Phytophthora pseudosyringae]